MNIGFLNHFYENRSTKYSNSVVMTYKNLSDMLDTFDGILTDWWNNFTDKISSLKMYPLNISSSDEKWLKVNNLRPAVNVYDIDYKSSYLGLGQFKINPYYNDFRDYKGYTFIKLYLPFLGFIDLDVNECMNKYLQFRLLVDFYSGKGMYIIGTTEEDIQSHMLDPRYPSLYGYEEYITPIANYECKIGIDIPLGMSNDSDIQRNLLLGTIKTGVSLFSNLYSTNLPPSSSTTTSTKTYDVYGRGTSKGSRLKQVKSGTVTSERTKTYNTPTNNVKPIAQAIDSSIDVINRNQPNSTSDRINDSSLIYQMGTDVSIIIYRPKTITNVNYNYKHLYGRPLGEVRTLSELTGYTEITDIHIEDEAFKSATLDEMELLKNTLSNGVFL